MKPLRFLIRFTGVALLAIQIAACTSNDSPARVTPVNAAPVVNAGVDQTVTEGAPVALAGSASDPDGAIASVRWEQVSGAPVTLNATDTAETGFTAPDGPVELVFRFAATDDAGASASDTVTVQVLDAPVVGACRTAPEDYVVRNELAPGTPSAVALPLLRFVQMSDEHIMDDDGQAVNGLSPLDALHSTFNSAMRFQDDYTDEVLNRMIATLNGCHAQRPIELVISTGDNTDLGTVAELRRYIDNLDGAFDQPSDFDAKCRAQFAGAPEDLLHASCTRFTGKGVADTQSTDPDPEAFEYQLIQTRTALQLQDTEQAVLSGRNCLGNADPATERCSTDPARQTATRAPGLPQELRCHAGAPGCANQKLAVPYYTAFGNHDGYARGTVVITEPGLQEAAFAFGRHYLRQQREFIDELFFTAAAPGPVGHGFNHVDEARFKDADGRNDGYYAFDAGAASGAGRQPIRMIVLNTIIDGTDERLPAPLRDPLRNPFGLSDGMLDAQQFEWLQRELAAAHEDGKLVLVFSHHTDRDFVEFGDFGEGAPLSVPAAALDAELASYPNVIAWFFGHKHRHRIWPFKVEDGVGSNRPIGRITTPVSCKVAGRCTGFWQINTAALIAFPQEARLLEIFDNGDGTGTLRSTVLQHDFERSKVLAEWDDRCELYLTENPGAVPQLIGDADTNLCQQDGSKRRGAPSDRNVELIFRFPP